MAMKAEVKQKKTTLFIPLATGLTIIPTVIIFLNQQPSNTDHREIAKNEKDEAAMQELMDEKVWFVFGWQHQLLV